ncbi:MAG: amidohydrolase family protein [Armatimonadetes bacterium]|nr:amidohydrolase family protein [Armatimonadota bacterium]
MPVGRVPPRAGAIRAAAALGLLAAMVLPSSARTAAPAPHAAYDVVIRNGRIIDPETKFDAAEFAVGITGKTIAAITREPIRGRVEIDAAGRVVAPGFIDILSYNPNSYGVWYKLADGVTTILAMEGAAVDMGAWYRAYERYRPPLHFGGGFHYAAARARQGLGRYTAASPRQIARLTVLAEKALEAGALGIAMTLEYVPGISADEVEAMMRVAGRYNVPVFFHVRYSDMEPPGTNLDALNEVIGAARRTGAAVHMLHLTSTGGTFSMAESLRLLEAARQEGLVIAACAYPYPYWATYLNSARFDPGWQRRFRISYQDLQLAGSDERLTPASFRNYRRQGKIAVAYAIPEEDLVNALRSPLVMIGSDAILEPGNNNHPRAAGAFTRTLSEYVRERGVLTLMDALGKMTIMPARELEAQVPALRRKGRLQVGADADIVIFDPARVRDRATVERPNQFSEGMEYVLVNGQVVKDPRGFHRQVRVGEGIRAVFRRAEPAETLQLNINGRAVPAYQLDGVTLVDVLWLNQFGYAVNADRRLRVVTVSAAGTAPDGSGASKAQEPSAATIPPTLSGSKRVQEIKYTVRFGAEMVKAYGLDDRVYVPVRDLSAMGAITAWDGMRRTVDVMLPGFSR